MTGPWLELSVNSRSGTKFVTDDSCSRPLAWNRNKLPCRSSPPSLLVMFSMLCIQRDISSGTVNQRQMVDTSASIDELVVLMFLVL